MMRILLTFLCAMALPGAALAEVHEFKLARAGEAVARLTLSSPHGDWAVKGREAAVAEIRVDGGAAHHVILWAGAVDHTYGVFLGRLEAGKHKLSIERSAAHSAPGAKLNIKAVKTELCESDACAHAPVLFARDNTIGRFSDIPMMVYAELLGGDLQYTVIFSNEDGGTSTRALMARWGRTTDIEYVCRTTLASSRTIVQGPGHKDLPYEGEKWGRHPLLKAVTDNNMVQRGDSALRFQILPELVDLTGRAREQVQDSAPGIYSVMSKELEREAKLRAFGTVDGQKISDPRYYLYVEFTAEQRDAAIAVAVRRRGENVWRQSSLGRPDYQVERSGEIRVAVELPPGTKGEDLEEILFECSPAYQGRARGFALAGVCELRAMRGAFFLTRDYKPGPNLWQTPPVKVEIPSGNMRVYRFRP